MKVDSNYEGELFEDFDTWLDTERVSKALAATVK